jgi:hypothetical protein
MAGGEQHRGGETSDHSGEVQATGVDHDRSPDFPTVMFVTP